MYIYPFISRNLKRVTTAELPDEVSNWVFYKLARSLARRRFDLRLPKGIQQNGVIVRQDVGKLGSAQRKIALCDSEGLFRLLLKKIDAEKQDEPSNEAETNLAVEIRRRQLINFRDSRAYRDSIDATWTAIEPTFRFLGSILLSMLLREEITRIHAPLATGVSINGVAQWITS